MNYAVLGANSFTGRAFCYHLLRATGRAPLPLTRPEFDLNDSGVIEAALLQAKPDVVVNFAALNMVGESWRYAQDYYRTNVLGLARLADFLAGQRWLKKFVQVSTPEVYGATLEQLSEGAPFRPSTPYAVSRAAGDLHLAALFREHGFPVCFTRSVNVYGPRQQPYRLIPKTVLKVLRGEPLLLHGGGESKRSFLHVEDMARAIQAVAEHGVPGKAYHCAGNELTRIDAVVQAVCNELQVGYDDVVQHAPERPGKDPAYWLDDARMRQGLAWAPKIHFAQGLADTVAWFKANAARYAGKPLEYEHRA
jgi:dTDP-glucose 4,6-dehydratase